MEHIDLHINIFFLISISILGGLFGAKLFKKIKVPQFLGYIIAGILIGKSGFKLINADFIETFKTFNFFALGIIGFLVGGELYFNNLKKYAKQFASILLFEGIMAFLFCGLLTAGVLYYITGEIHLSIAAGMIVGAIASATDPASTMSVIWEYRARGVLTTTISSVIALDDVLAMTLYGISVGIARILVSSESAIFIQILNVFYELGGSVCLGLLMGLFSNYILKMSDSKKNTTSIILGSLILIISIAQMLGFDIILSSLSAGILLINIAPERSKRIFELVRDFAAPIYIIFFVSVGANLELVGMPRWLWLIVVLYVVGRNLGKVLGSYLGATLSRAPKNVRHFTGFGLFAQGGAAIGLAIMAGYHLQNIQVLHTNLGQLVVSCITATTFLIQVIGPIMVKMSVKWADEINRDITEEDIVSKYLCKDMVSKDMIVLKQDDSIDQVFKMISNSNQAIFPVIDKNKKMIGYINLDLIRNLLLERDTWNWILAGDVCMSYRDSVYQDSPLQEAITVLNQKNIEQLIILSDSLEYTPVGIIDKDLMDRKIKFEIIQQRDAKL